MYDPTELIHDTPIRRRALGETPRAARPGTTPLVSLHVPRSVLRVAPLVVALFAALPVRRV